MQHVINKQFFELVVNRKQDPFYIQQRMSEFYRSHIVPMLDQIFDTLGPEGEVLRVERLVIDLGSIDLKNIEQSKAPHDLYQTLLAQISAAALRPKDKQHTGIRSAVLSVAGQWLFYMEHGYLPWNSVTVNERWYEQTLEALACDFDTVTRLRKLVATNGTALLRIVTQHNDAFLVKLVRTLTSQSQDNLSLEIEDLRVIMAATVYAKNNVLSTSDIRDAVWQVIVSTASTSGNTTTPLAQRAVERMIARSYSVAIRECLDVLKSEDIRAVVLQSLSTDNKTTIEPKEITLKKPQRPSSTEETLSMAPQLADEGIFIRDAGLVLLHPFLKTFLRRINLVQHDAFVSHEACHRAMHLLFYLAHGRQSPHEHELVIPKTLCGYPLHETVVHDLVLTDEELNEADDLLRAVIAQWTIVENTSPDGLREGFLQRKGKLSVRQKKFYLQVESHSIDVLLDYLPWTLSMIKLPWQQDMLHVEWR